MPEGIKNKVAIIGMGCTKFGELWDKSAEDLMVDAFQEALEDAGIEFNVRGELPKAMLSIGIMQIQVSEDDEAEARKVLEGIEEKEENEE